MDEGKVDAFAREGVDIAELFQLSTDRLMGAQFSDLLARELADPERFERVETRIQCGRSKLKSV